MVFDDVYDLYNEDDLLVKVGVEVDEVVVIKVENMGIDKLIIRLFFICCIRGGVCVFCYGRDLV